MGIYTCLGGLKKYICLCISGILDGFIFLFYLFLLSNRIHGMVISFVPWVPPGSLGPPLVILGGFLGSMGATSWFPAYPPLDPWILLLGPNGSPWRPMAPPLGPMARWRGRSFAAF